MAVRTADAARPARANVTQRGFLRAVLGVSGVDAAENDMIFWAVAGVLTAVVTATLVRAVIRGGGDGMADGAHDLRVYRDQLSEVDRDLARGVLDADSAARARAEVGRRTLAADRVLRNTAARSGSGPRGTAIAVLLILVAALGGYFWLGAPGYGDLPLKARFKAAEALRADRPSQAEAEAAMPPGPEPEAGVADLVAQLRASLAEHGDQIEGLAILTRSELSLGNTAGARDAHQRLVALKGAAATPDDRAALLDLMVMAAGGYVSPEAEVSALGLIGDDPAGGAARYYLGLMHAQTGRPDLAFDLWRALFEEGPEDAPWMAPIRAALPDLAALAGVDYTAPPPARGPSPEDVAAASGLDDAARAEMIRGMVEGLADRLATDGGPAADWARLIRALGILGEAPRAAAIWSEAQARFAGAPGDLALIRVEAVAAGVAQ